jgi:hypothetical protein
MALEVYGFGLSDIIAIAALAVSSVTVSILYVGHTKRTRSEQFHFALEIMDRITAQVNIIERWLDLGKVDREREKINLYDTLVTLSNELTFFIYLTDKGEIGNPTVRSYFAGPLTDVLGKILKNRLTKTLCQQYLTCKI